MTTVSESKQNYIKNYTLKKYTFYQAVSHIDPASFSIVMSVHILMTGTWNAHQSSEQKLESTKN